MADTVGNSPNQALQITPARTERVFAESVEPGDLDFYRFSLRSTSAVTLRLTGLTANADLQLLLNTGGVVQESTNEGTLPELVNVVLNAGDYYVRVAPGPAVGGVTPTTNYSLRVAADNGARATDIVWRNEATGVARFWRMDGTQKVGETDFTGPLISSFSTDLGWRLETTGDLDNDGNTDIILRNYGNSADRGRTAVWYLDAASAVTEVRFLQTEADLNWQVRGAADFTGDGRTDLVWHYRGTGSNQGRVVVWQMDNTNRANVNRLGLTELPRLDNIRWYLSAVGDYSGDGRPDIVWRNFDTGQNAFWYMNGTTRTSAVTFQTNNSLSSAIFGSGDYNGDGFADLLWSNVSSGANEVWLMNGTSRLSVESIAAIDPPPARWRAAAPLLRQVTPTPLDVAGGTAASAFQLGGLNGNGLYRESLTATDGTDFYQFSIGSTARVTINLDRINGGVLTEGIDLELQTASGNQVQLSSTTGNEAITIDNLESGTYYLRVFAATPGAIDDYELRLSANSIPFPVANNPLTVTEGDAGLISQTLLEYRDANDPPENLLYRLETAPVNGTLFIGTASLAAGQPFTQAAINAGTLSYRHSGNETIGDTFVFTLTDGRNGNIGNTTFSIRVLATNDPPQLLTNAGTVVNEGSSVTIGSAVLAATDTEQTAPGQLVYTLTSLPANGFLLLNQTALAQNSVFTQADINNNRLLYTHNGNETPLNDSFSFTLTDGAGGVTTPTVNVFNLAITPTNDIPVVVTNQTLLLTNSSVPVTLSETNLKTTDSELPDNDLSQVDKIRYTITRPPANGEISVGPNTSNTFTEADLRQGRVVYTPTRTGVNSDFFVFDVADDAGGTRTAVTFNIAIPFTNTAPVLSLNTGLTVNEGAAAPITPAELLFTDLDDGPSQIIYTLGTRPANGILKLGGVPLTEGSTFRQSDLAVPNRLTYEHGGGENQADSFVFSVADVRGAGVTSQTFNVTVTPVSDPPTLVTRGTLSLTEGQTATLSTAVLSATDIDSTPSEVTYRITRAPQRGGLVRGSETTTLSSFTQAELESGIIEYRHDGSEVSTDNFVFQLDDEANTGTVSQTLNIAVTLVNDTPVISGSLAITDVDEGSRATIAAANLDVTDGDDAQNTLFYTLETAPTLGTLLLNDVPITAGTFTQADITGNRLTYSHGGAETPLTDRFLVRASDRRGATSPSTSFSIAIRPVNDPPVITVGAPAVTIDEEQAITNLGISVTDAEGSNVSVVLSATNGQFSLSGAPPQGTLTIPSASITTVNSALSNITYRPNLNYFGTDAIQVTAIDAASATATRQIDLVVNPRNDPPTLSTTATGLALTEDQAGTFSITPGDVDAGTNPVQVELRATSGNLTLAGLGGLTFQNGSRNGTNSLLFVGTLADITTALTNVSYQGNPNFSGADQITATINDQGFVGAPGPQTATLTLPVTITAVNDPPSFVAGPNIIVDEVSDAAPPSRQTIPGWATQISQGAPDETGILTFTLTPADPTLFQGSLAIDPATGNLTYTLARNAAGTTTVTAGLRDAGGAQSALSTFTFNVNPVNDAPTFTLNTSTVQVAEDSGAYNQPVATGISAGPAGPGSAGNETAQNVTFVIESNSRPELFAAAGQPQITAAGNLQFTPEANAFGNAVITVRLQDDGGTDNGGVDTTPLRTLTIAVQPVNDPPSVNLPLTPPTTPEDTVLTVAGVSVSDVDAGDGLISVSLSALGIGGTIANAGTISVSATPGVTFAGASEGRVVQLSGRLTDVNTALTSFRYTPRANLNGTDQIQIQVNDNGNTGGGSQVDTETLNVTVTQVNDPPTLSVTPTTVRTPTEDLLFTLAGVTLTDVDAGTSTLTLNLASQENGLIGFANPAGLGGYNGPASNLTVTGTLTALRAALPGLTYLSRADYNGADQVTISVTDADNASDIRVISLNVLPVNDPPRFVSVPAAPISVGEDLPLAFTGPTAIEITDVDSNLVRATLRVTNGTLTLSTPLTPVGGANGTSSVIYEGSVADLNTALASLVYQGNANVSNITDTLTIGLTDGQASLTNNVTINVTEIDDPPALLTNATLTVAEGTLQTISSGALRATDPDDGNDQIIYTVNRVPTLGALQLGTTPLGVNGTFTQADIQAGLLRYSHNGAETPLADSFDFTLAGLTGARTFNFQIASRNDLPTLPTPPVISVDEGRSITITSATLAATDPDNTAPQLRYIVRAIPANGTLRVGGTAITRNGSFTQQDVINRSVVYAHSGSETTNDRFVFDLTDGAGGTLSSRTLSITVNSVNDVPEIRTNGPLIVEEGGSATIAENTLFTFDPDGPQPITYRLLAAPVRGTLLRDGVALTGGNTFTQQDIQLQRVTYQHDDSETTFDVFSYEVSDNGFTTSQRSAFQIQVTPFNDAPVLQTPNPQITIPGAADFVAPIDPGLLFTTDAEDTDPSRITYRLQTVPNVGRLQLGGVDLSAGGEFTQRDINDGRVRYLYTANTGGGNETFLFTVRDSQNVELSAELFTIVFNY